MISRRDFLIGLAALPAVAFPLPGLLAVEATFDRLLRLARRNDLARLPIGQAVGEIAMALVGTRYVGGVLDEDARQEACVVDLDRLDCVTLYESALAFARLIRKDRSSLEDFRRELTTLRYRDGKLRGYLSRLHYTTDWLSDNHRRGVVRLLADLPGSEPLRRKIDFMSRNPQSYPQLRINPDLLPELRKIEARLSEQSLRFVPTAKVATAEPKLETGDIIGIITSVEGLDCSHTGLCYRQNGVLRLLHASSTRKQVLLDVRLSEYVAANSRNLGIIAARPLG
jgi:hypothetical protein